MVRKTLLIDIDQCVRCYACEVACEQENDLDVGARWLQVATIEPRTVGQGLHMDFVPMLCFHCDDPPCAYFCAPGAIVKRENGIVLIDQDKCNKCKLCVYGCPYGAIYWDEKRGTIGKCDLCTERLDRGLEPSCVQHCIGGAIQFVTEAELTSRTGNQYRTRVGKVCYTSTKWALKTAEISD